VSIASATGGGFAAIDTSTPPATVTVTDTVTPATVSLGDVTVDEGGNATITATLDFPVTGSPLVITLSNGATITIPVGATSGTSTPFSPPNGEDPYNDPGSSTLTINGTTGGNFEALDTADTATVTVNDTVNATTVTLGDVAVDEGGNVTVTATLSNPVTGSPLVITLSNGATITIPVGATSGTSTPFAPGNTEDPYNDPSSSVVSINGTSGGNFEALDTTDTAAVTVNDTVNATTITLGDVTVDEGGNASITATLSNPVTGSPLVITLSNGATITIPVGATSGTSTPFAPGNTEDPYNDPSNSVVSINGTSGGNFEALDTTDTATVTVNDTVNTSTVTLDDPVVTEGGQVTLTATVDNAPQGSDLVLTLSNGQTITIKAGETTGSVTFAAPSDDPYVDAGSYQVKIESATGGNYESLDTSDVSTVTINDDIDATVVTLGEVTQLEGTNATLSATITNAPTTEPLIIQLSNGAELRFEIGQKTATSSVFNLPVTQHGAPGAGTDGAISYEVTGVV